MPDHFEIDLETARRRRSLKWRRYSADVIPLWVAEMDFPLAPAVTERLAGMVERSDFGYPPEPPEETNSEFRAVVAAWMNRRHQWEVDPEMVSITPDTMRAIEIAIERFTDPGDPVVLSDPVYYPFRVAIEEAGRRPLWVPMVESNRRWVLDLEALAAAFAPGNVQLFLHCSPHNPTGTVFTADEQQSIAALAEQHNVIVVADEVHADLAYDASHIPFATINPEIAARTITASAASKAFNFAGLRCGFVIAGDQRLHEQVQSVPIRDRKLASLAGYEATIAAYGGGASWLESLHRHLREMRDHVIGRLAMIEESLVVANPEASYLLWTDWRQIDLAPDPATYLRENAGVALSSGDDFGPSGTGFLRLNFGTSRAILDEALDRIEDALAGS
ncbi:MAG: putative C-S lyase [Acidimicrobiia bacterium]|nr:putative C-S lyase [Acidimicrobiia bacterium]